MVSGTYRGTSISRLMQSAWMPSNGALGSPNPVIPWAVWATAFTRPTMARSTATSPIAPLLPGAPRSPRRRTNSRTAQ